MFYAGIRPAVNIGLSVSRVGGAAQIKAMKKVASRLRLDLAQYRELAVFSQFGSDLDESTQRLLAQGERITEILKQEQYKPMDVAHQVVILYVAMQKMLLDIPVDLTHKFKSGFLQYIDNHHYDIIKNIYTTGDLTDENIEKLNEAINSYKNIFKSEK